MRRCDYEESDHVVNFMGAYKFKEMFNKSIYDDLDNYSFEDMELIAPRQYDIVLRQMYGDYMQVPKDKDKYKHHVNVIQGKENQ